MTDRPDRFDDLIDGTLSAEQEAALEREAANDAELQRALQETRQLKAAFTQLDTQTTPLALQARLKRIPRRPGPWRMVAAAAATVLVALVLLPLWQQPNESNDLAAAQRDLEIASEYLQLVNETVNRHVQSNLQRSVGSTLAANTLPFMTKHLTQEK